MWRYWFIHGDIIIGRSGVILIGSIMIGHLR